MHMRTLLAALLALVGFAAQAQPINAPPSDLPRATIPAAGFILWASPTGNDSNDCLTLGKACATVQHAVDIAIRTLDAKSGGSSLNIADINLEPGKTFNECVQVLGTVPGNGFISIHGSGAKSTITCNGNTLTANYFANVRLKNLILGSTGGGWCLGAKGNSYIQISDASIEFTDCAGLQLDASGNSMIQALAGYTVSGGGVGHWHSHEGGIILVDETVVTCTGTPAFSAYWAGVSFGRVNAINTTFSGCGGVTGAKFTANRLGSIRTAPIGEGDINVFPGNMPGTVSSNATFDGFGTGGWVVRNQPALTVDTVASTDWLVIRTGYDGRARTETLPDCTSTVGPRREFVIKDGLGNANISPIVISAPTSLIDGKASYSLNTAGGAVSLYCDGVSAWVVDSGAWQGYPQSTLAALPAAAVGIGSIYLVTDVGLAGSLWRSNGTEWRPLAPVTLGRGAAQVPHTGDTAEFTAATVTIPANCMGLNGRLQIKGAWSFTGSTNTKSARARLGGLAGTAVLLATASTAANITFNSSVTVANRNSASSQITMSNGVGDGQSAFGTTALIAPAIDTTTATTVVFTSQLGSTGETISLERYEVTLLP